MPQKRNEVLNRRPQGKSNLDCQAYPHPDWLSFNHTSDYMISQTKLLKWQLITENKNNLKKISSDM